MGDGKYSLASEKEKLLGRSKIFDRQSKYFLPKIFKLGQKVLEIGCGMGGATSLIADLLENTGFITAIDINEFYVDFTRDKLQAAGFDHFTIQQKSVDELDFHQEKFDVIYGRAIIHHLKNAKEKISHLLKFLKPNGIIAFEEPIITSFYADPPVASYTNLFKWYQELGNIKGLDYNIGAKLGIIFQELNLNILELKYIQLALIELSERLAMYEVFPTLENQFLENGIATAEEITKAKLELYQLAESKQLLYHGKFCQIIGTQNS